MSQPDQAAGEEPVFSEPWEAEAFAMAVTLSERGLFTWKEWAECLGAEIRADPQRPYYEHWLSALEAMLEHKRVMNRDERLLRIEAWRDAARHTPHGQPIKLAGNG